jgi:hypothetical protein
MRCGHPRRPKISLLAVVVSDNSKGFDHQYAALAQTAAGETFSLKSRTAISSTIMMITASTRSLILLPSQHGPDDLI